MYTHTGIGVKVGLLLLNTGVINDSQQLDGTVRCTHSKLLWVLLGVPVETTELDTFNAREEKRERRDQGYNM